MAEFSLVILIVAVALVFGYRYALRRGRQMAMLVSRGTEVTGSVIDTKQVRRSRTHTSFRVRYDFVTTGGVRHEREIEVLPKEFAQYVKGQEIGIVYDPAEPGNNMLSSAVAAARDAMNKRQMQTTGD